MGMKWYVPLSSNLYVWQYSLPHPKAFVWLAARGAREGKSLLLPNLESQLRSSTQTLHARFLNEATGWEWGGNTWHLWCYTYDFGQRCMNHFMPISRQDACFAVGLRVQPHLLCWEFRIQSVYDRRLCRFEHTCSLVHYTKGTKKENWLLRGKMSWWQMSVKGAWCQLGSQYLCSVCIQKEKAQSDWRLYVLCRKPIQKGGTVNVGKELQLQGVNDMVRPKIQKELA